MNAALDAYLRQLDATSRNAWREGAGAPATSADLARAEVFLDRSLPEDVETLYRRHNGGIPAPGVGSFAPLPTTRRDALEGHEFAVGAPFGVLDHVTVVRWDHVAFDVALDDAHTGEVWEIMIDADPGPVGRVTRSLVDLLQIWTEQLADGLYRWEPYGLGVNDDHPLADRTMEGPNMTVLDIEHIEELDPSRWSELRKTRYAEIQALLTAAGEGMPTPTPDRLDWEDQARDNIMGTIMDGLSGGLPIDDIQRRVADLDLGPDDDTPPDAPPRR